jgi:hypothetical protein
MNHSYRFTAWLKTWIRRLNMDTEKDIQQELYNSRMRLKKEMQRALSCISPTAKRKLAREWEEKYSALFYKELLACAKNKKVATEIADWTEERMR